ncbi:MAG: ribosome biogenesis GTP-binding protein YihA/YsxC [Eubacteriales bacterium]|nr:ribosome biogenesis GTP-binding protein YihA/YsxC [Eubacteriales bacterium]
MVIKSAELETVCGITSKLPQNDGYEIAFAGKSNVGKSSLINGLLNRKALARTSSQPGKTQTINFYHINEQFYFVDLPGYGYAKVSATEREKWGKMIERYLHTSEKLVLVFLLIDIRHEPSANDKMMYDWILDNGFTPVIIATKSDKIKRSQLQKQIKIIKTKLQMQSGDMLFPFSAMSKQGKEEILDYIEDVIHEAEYGDGVDILE